MQVGVDMVQVSAFAAQLDIPGSRFRAVFTDRELRDCAGKPNRAASLAARWAAKEAYVKAWANTRYGTAPALAELNFADIEVVADTFGRVTLALRGSLADVAPPAQSLSVSHDGDYAIAVCLLAPAC